MSSSPSEFHLFPLLPTELRLQIWSLAMPPRQLPITCIKGVHPNKRRYASHFHTTTPPPPLLYASTESRRQALAVYTPRFRTDARPEGLYVSFALDTLHVEDGTLAHLGDEELEGIQLLAVAVKDNAYFGHYNFGTLRRMRDLRVLELQVVEGLVTSWSARNAFEAMHMDIEYELGEWMVLGEREVRIVDVTTGKEVLVVVDPETIPREGGPINSLASPI